MASSRMSYSRFLEYLDMGRVKKVLCCAYATCQACASPPWPLQYCGLYLEELTCALSLLSKRMLQASRGIGAHIQLSIRQTNKARPDIFKLKQCSACAQVDLYENGTIAIVEAVSPELGNRVQRVRVQLPGTSQEQLQRFREKSVDFAAHSNTEDGGAVFLNLLGEPAWVGCVQACLSALFQCAAYTLSTSYLLFYIFPVMVCL